MTNVLGIDLGTSELKVLIMGVHGDVLAIAKSPLVWGQPRPGWAEQEPASWWDALLFACTELAQAAPEAYSAIRAIGLSGQMHGATVLDVDQRVLRPCILWNDSRSEAQCIELTNSCEDLHKLTGNLAMPGFTAPKLLWLREFEPELFRRVESVLLPKDYLRLLLTGTQVSDMSDASGTLWLDVGKRAWSNTMLHATGLREAHMPSLVEGCSVSGYLDKRAAQRLGLTSGIPVAGGAGDNAASAIGIGAIKPGDSFISLGTSGVMFTVTEQHHPNVNEAVHAFCHALPGVWHQMTVMLSAASALRWITQTTGRASETHLMGEVEQLSAREREAAPVFLPYLSGERTPHNDAAASGVFLGLRHNHTAAHLAFAVIDGICLGMRDGLDALRRAGSQPTEFQLVGGGSRSMLWAQLMADALNAKIFIGQDSGVGAALGAARLGRLCETGTSEEWLSRVCRPPHMLHQFSPSEHGVRVSQHRQAIYRSAYQQLRPIFKLATSN